ncbi:MAG: hypothetical protein ACE5LA_02410 [Dehalococcoidales bacterium]
MSELPKLKVRAWPRIYPRAREAIRDFEQAKDFLHFDLNHIITVEGEEITSYEELVRLAAKECYKDKEFLKVEIVSLMCGG